LKDALSGLASASGSASINVDNIFNCGFSAFADQMIASIKDLIGEASGCNPTKISDISAKLKALITSVPASIKTCLASSSDAKSLFDGLHLTGKTPDQIQTDVINFVLSNPLTACWDLQGLQSDITSGNMNKLGSDGGALIKKIYSSKALDVVDDDDFAYDDEFVYVDEFVDNDDPLDDDDLVKFVRDSTSDLKDALSGLASASGSASINVDNIFNCGFSAFADQMIASIKDLIGEASGCNPTKISDISAKLKALITSVPASIKTCLASSSDAKSLFDGLHLTGKTPDQIQTDVINYVLANPLTACLDLQDLQSDITSGDMKKLGADGGALIKKVSSSKFADMDDNEMLAQVILFALQMAA